MKTKIISALLGIMLFAMRSASAQEATAAERAAMLKANMEASKIILRQYQWIETTVVSLNSDEKSRKQQQCYYGADGKVQKVELYQSTPDSEPRGPLRRRIAERKKEELTDYMKEAISLVREYVPPDPLKLQAAKERGNLAMQILEPGKRVRLTISNYLKLIDSFSFDIDLTANRPLAGKVSTLVDSDQSPISLTLTFDALESNATYVSRAVLNAPDKNLTVTVDNSGYRKSAP